MHEQSPLSRPRRHDRSKLLKAAAACFAATVFAVLAASCSDNARDPIILGNDLNDASGGPVFVDPSEAGADAEGGLIEYCASSKCPEGHVTCPGSYFACDVDLQTDIRNCGACGVNCPQPSNAETFECVAGSCVMHCNIGPTYLDCDGVSDNGCEIQPNTNDNCGACGNVCADPAKPCIEVHPDDFACGCPGGTRLCPPNDENAINHCVKNDDDKNCASCGDVCDPAGDGTKPSFDNTYFGCENSECGNLKCVDGYANCDGDLLNGCEASLASDDNCGGCGKPCGAGQKCSLGLDGRAFCACPDNTTFCGFCPKICTDAGCVELGCIGSCRDLTSDVNACGSCAVSCDVGSPFAEPVCSYGSCQERCPDGRADCNGNTSDGCEVTTQTDPSNCGGCGIKCDAIAGQACVGGRCVVEPCGPITSDGGAAK
jgi:hypothetical protein